MKIFLSIPDDTKRTMTSIEIKNDTSFFSSLLSISHTDPFVVILFTDIVTYIFVLIQYRLILLISNLNQKKYS